MCSFFQGHSGMNLRTKNTCTFPYQMSLPTVDTISLRINVANSRFSLVVGLEIRKFPPVMSVKSCKRVAFCPISDMTEISRDVVGDCHLAQVELDESLIDVKYLRSFSQTLTKSHKTHQGSACFTVLLHNSGHVYFSNDPQFAQLLFSKTPLLKPIDLGDIRVKDLALVGTHRLFVVTTDSRIYDKRISSSDPQSRLEDVTDKLRLYSRHNLRLFGSEHLLFVNNTSTRDSEQITVYYIENAAECCKNRSEFSGDFLQNYSCWDYSSFAGSGDVKEIFRWTGTILSSSPTFDAHQSLLLVRPLPLVPARTVLYMAIS